MNKTIKGILRKLLPSTNRKYKILSGELKGMFIYASLRDYPSAILGYGEKNLLRWFSNNIKPGETWIDIGGHYGMTGLAMSKAVTSKGNVFTFEPMLSSIGSMNSTRKANLMKHWTLIPYGLTQTNNFNFEELSSHRGMIDSGLTPSVDDFLERFITISFDSFCELHPSKIKNISGVKIDVQGMEEFVLNGMVKTLKKYKPKVIIEFHKGVNRDAIIKFLKSLGYNHQAFDIDNQIQNTDKFIDDTNYLFAFGN